MLYHFLHILGIISRIVNQYFEQMGIVRMNWAARSRDLSPIKHLKIAKLQQPPATFPEPTLTLTQVLEEADQKE
ncbi:hypothetical protein BDFB_009944, partial [Asbolus verrucosus]